MLAAAFNLLDLAFAQDFYLLITAEAGEALGAMLQVKEIAAFSTRGRQAVGFFI